MAEVDGAQSKTSFAQRRIAEIHEYARHSVGLYLNWFTIWITINFATMGWVVANLEGASYSRSATIGLAVFFASQHLLGIIGARFIFTHLSEGHQNVRALHEDYQSRTENLPEELRSSLPLKFYGRVFVLLSIALASLSIAWVTLAFFMYDSPP